MMNLKQQLFQHYRKSLLDAGLRTQSENSLICPLCWEVTEYDSLTLEHFVPGAVGGKDKILTCVGCNNDQGSKLDAHLARFQQISDAFYGHGTIPAEFRVNGYKLTTNLAWGDTKNFIVVGKASNPAAEKAIQAEFAAGRVSQVDFTLDFGYSKNLFQTAVLRSAYLVMFKCFGYEYASHEIVQVIRRRIADPMLEHPRLASLVIEARDFQPDHDAQHYAMEGEANGMGFFLVLIRVRMKTTTFLGAYLPMPWRCGDEFFSVMEQVALEFDGETLSIPRTGMFS